MCGGGFGVPSGCDVSADWVYFWVHAVEGLVGVVFSVPSIVESEADVTSGVCGDDVADRCGVEPCELAHDLGVCLLGHSLRVGRVFAFR